MKITPKIATEIASHEAIVRQAYLDSVGVLTWGIGITNQSGHSVDRYIDNPQPLTKVMEVFMWALERYAKDVSEAFEGVELTVEQFTAALSFHYNTGAIKRASWVKQFVAGERTKARKSFMNWRKPAEIIERREKERDLFFDGIWSNTGTIPEYPRLTSRGTPVWSSRIDIDASECFAPVAPLENPGPVPLPSKSQTPINDAPFGGIVTGLLAFLSRLFGGKTDG